MAGFFAFAVVLAVLLGLYGALRGKSPGTGQSWPVSARRLLTASESRLLTRLQEALPGHVVLSQVALSQLIEVKRGKEHVWARNKVFRKVVDFVVLNSDHAVHCVIELDGSSHDRPSRQRSDTDKSAALAAAGYTLHRLNPAEPMTGTTLRQTILGAPITATTPSSLRLEPKL